MMTYNYAKLNGKIAEVCGTQLIFARQMGLSERSVSLKINNKVPWKQQEMIKAAEVLGFPVAEIQLYFFDVQVQAS